MFHGFSTKVPDPSFPLDAGDITGVLIVALALSVTFLVQTLMCVMSCCMQTGRFCATSQASCCRRDGDASWVLFGLDVMLALLLIAGGTVGWIQVNDDNADAFYFRSDTRTAMGITLALAFCTIALALVEMSMLLVRGNLLRGSRAVKPTTWASVYGMTCGRFGQLALRCVLLVLDIVTFASYTQAWQDLNDGASDIRMGGPGAAVVAAGTLAAVFDVALLVVSVLATCRQSRGDMHGATVFCDALLFVVMVGLCGWYAYYVFKADHKSLLTDYDVDGEGLMVSAAVGGVLEPILRVMMVGVVMVRRAFEKGSDHGGINRLQVGGGGGGVYQPPAAMHLQQQQQQQFQQQEGGGAILA